MHTTSVCQKRGLTSLTLWLLLISYLCQFFCFSISLTPPPQNAELVKRLKAYREEPISKTATVAEAANKTEECCQTPEVRGCKSWIVNLVEETSMLH